MPAAVLDADACYAAVAARDADQDGRFVTAVVTTGIFCKPSCPARTPKRENVRFYADAEDAVRAGFRPCKRCKPTEADPELAAMAAVARRIAAQADQPLPLAALASEAGVSAGRLQRRFTAVFGLSPKAFQDAARLGRLKTALRGGARVIDAGYDAGYGSASRLHHAAAKGLGMTPSAYRDGGAGEIIAYAARDTALGRVMLAATKKGVCFVQFGPDDDALHAELAREFPRAALAPAAEAARPDLDAWITALDAHLSTGGPRPDLPLDLRGTAFQMAVWRFLQTIPAGEVVSYTEAAAALGKPKAVRALASACARNRVAVLVPCHRVLRGDGSLGGYRGGLDRKRALIASERQAASDA